MNARKLSAGLIALTIMLVAVVACAPAPTATPVPPTAAPTRIPATLAPTATPVPPTAAPTKIPPTVAPTPVPATATPAPITVTDGANRSVTISALPQRIISLAPSTTEIAFALGLGRRVVAVDSFSDYPAETKDLPKIKTYPLNLEQIVALKPDLVLAAGIQSPDDIKKLADLKLTVLVVGSMNTTFDSVTADIALVGKATGTDAKAKTIADAMKQKVDAVKAKVANAQAKPRVYWELDATDPAKPYAPGPGSFINDIITLAGGVNATANAKTPYAQVNAEAIIAANPDLIILSDAAYGTTPESVKARGGWSAINAVKNNRIFPIDDNLVSRPGPRIADGLEAAAKIIHPELFK
jgi:iron complex transport system substrate-binding protein